MSPVRRYWKPIFIQAVAIFASLILSWLARFNFHWSYHPAILWQAVPLLLIARFIGLFLFHCVHGHWRYTGAADLARLVKATTVGSILFTIVERGILSRTAFPLSVYLIEFVFTTAALVAARAVFVLLLHRKRPQGQRAKSVRTLVIGAGFAGHMLAKELRGSNTGLCVVGFADDDHTKVGTRANGIPVLGTLEQLPSLVSNLDIQELLIAIPSATKSQLNRIVQICSDTKVRFRSVPSLSDIVSGRVRVNALKEAEVDDLIGRDKIELDLAPVIDFLADKVVMVTGAAGSIGSELCRQILHCGPEKLICIDQDETALFHLGKSLEDVSACQSETRFDLLMADVSHAETMRRVLAENSVRVIFHAAAYKHVPLVEANVAEATRNNVLALWKLLEIADESGCDRFVFISSDKAVNPSSYMGCTKRIGEMLVASFPARHLTSMSVRFGNVLGSQGSVVPTFKAQIARGDAITVTHPEMTRFFMAISEAVALVLQASTIGANGHIYVLDMGDPIKIVDLAKLLLRLSGKTEAEIPIRYTGMRPGEKLFEELFYGDEGMVGTSIDGLRIAKGRIVEWEGLKVHLEQLSNLLEGSTVLIRQKVKEMVPEYQQDFAGTTEYDQPLTGLLAVAGAGYIDLSASRPAGGLLDASA